ncbi:ExbD/TolR family protein [Phaeovulum sp. W22_SRMD_FR3]|uniref:ExbD/TolR family protein n=1 Tax=Phaeovulum sp. W22_SRMD_FR3 TaxID=3240274 RepID=UPI003F9CCA0A
MRIRRPLPRHPPETIVALIDVVFFLLIFFMLIGRMDASAPFEVLPPRAVSGADLPAGGVIVAIAADGDLALDGTAILPGALLPALRARLAADPALPIRVNAHRAAQLHDVLPWMDQIEALGARDVALVVTPGDLPGTP